MDTTTTIVKAEKHHVKQNLTNLLKREVEETFGRRIISSRDCIQLSEEIYFKAGNRINSNTLRRFYGLVKADYPASVSTLSILSKYCGFSSMDEIISMAGNREKPISTHDVEAGILDYLVSLFKSTFVRENNDETYLTMVRHTVQFISKHPNLAGNFQRAIAKTRNGQDFYFEQHVNLDKLNGFYGEGLRYYLNEKKDDDAQIFGYSLLCLRSWLNCDATEMKRNFEEIKRKRLSRSVHPLVAGRYYAAHLYFAELNGFNTDTILMDAQNTHLSLVPARDHYRLFPCFELTFGMALLITKHYNEALYYTDYALKNYPEQHHFLDKGFYRTLELMQALALVKCGHKKESDTVFLKIKPSQFYFLSKKTNTILYLVLSLNLNRNNPHLEQQLNDLIQETGFTRLKTLIR